VVDLIVICLYSNPIQLEYQSRGALAATLMVGNFNIVHKIVTSYPLIWNSVANTWSLGAEEQFYIIMPFIAGYIMKKSFKFGLKLFAITILISFALNVYVVETYGKWLAFMLPFTRFWQLLAGCMLAFW